MPERTIFFISDHTGITAETVGHSLLTQFRGIEFDCIALPYVNSVEKAQAAVDAINHVYARQGVQPLVFSSLTDRELREKIRQSQAVLFDLFDTFIEPLERVLQQPSSHAQGRSHGMGDAARYDTRIDAVNYVLQSDDGLNLERYREADVILTGVSRTGKTPTCVYLGLQFGLHAANYALTDDDLQRPLLPKPLKAHRTKLYGLTIDVERLQQIREGRRPGSRYASLRQCQKEVGAAEELFHHENIRYLNTTTLSIEEIATTILQELGLKRRIF